MAESKTLDYKLELPSNRHGSKREFLADVSSFANASGGHLVFGIEDEGGIPTAAPGLEVDDVEAATLRLENLIRDSVKLRIPGVLIQPVREPDNPPFEVTASCVQTDIWRVYRRTYATSGGLEPDFRAFCPSSPA